MDSVLVPILLLLLKGSKECNGSRYRGFFFFFSALSRWPSKAFLRPHSNSHINSHINSHNHNKCYQQQQQRKQQNDYQSSSLDSHVLLSALFLQNNNENSMENYLDSSRQQQQQQVDIQNLSNDLSAVNIVTTNCEQEKEQQDDENCIVESVTVLRRLPSDSIISNENLKYDVDEVNNGDIKYSYDDDDNSDNNDDRCRSDMEEEEELVDEIANLLMVQPPTTKMASSTDTSPLWSLNNNDSSSGSNSDYNNTTEDNLYLNSNLFSLQQIIQNQRKDLGRLRRNTHELERQLLSATRKQVMDEQNTLEQQDSIIWQLRQEVVDSQHSREKSLEEKEKIAAEYVLAVKSYIDLKHYMESQIKERHREKEASQQMISMLEAQLITTSKETQQWREECRNQANRCEFSITQINTLQEQIETLQAVVLVKDNEISALTEANLLEIEKVRAAVKEEEFQRSKSNVQTLSEEYERILSEKRKKLGKLRMALRSANEKRRRIEQGFQREKLKELKALRSKLRADLTELQCDIKQKEMEIERMNRLVKDAAGWAEERQRYLAEIMFLTISNEKLRSKLITDARGYKRRIECLKEDSALLSQANEDNIQTIEGLVLVSNAYVAKLFLMESQIEQLSIQCEEQQRINIETTMDLSKLTTELQETKSNASVLAEEMHVLRNETQSYDKILLNMENCIEILEEQKESLQHTLGTCTERSNALLEEKITCIALLERELAESYNDIHDVKKYLASVSSHLDEKSSQCDAGNERIQFLEDEVQFLKWELSSKIDDKRSTSGVERFHRLSNESSSTVIGEYKSLVASYESKMQFMAQQSLLSNQLICKKQKDVDRLQKKLEEVMSMTSSFSEEHTTLVMMDSNSSVEDATKTSRLAKAKAITQLLLKNLFLAEQKELIDSLTAENFLTVGQSSFNLTAEVEPYENEKDIVISVLRMQLVNLKDEYRSFKAKSNHKLLMKDSILESKEIQLLELQSKIDKLLAEQNDFSPNSTFNNNSRWKDDLITRLRLDLEEVLSSFNESQSKAREKLLHKNRILMEKDDKIAELTKEYKDLQWENELIEKKWKDELQRSKEFFLSHELQVQAIEDKLKKDHFSAMTNLEKNRNKTMHELEMEIKYLKSAIVINKEDRSLSDKDGVKNSEFLRLHELQEMLRLSQETEVSLINQNMRMKNKIEMLEAQQKVLPLLHRSAHSHEGDSTKTEVDLPFYYKAKKRSWLKRMVGDVWKRLIRHKKR